jgi:DNA (cytosine-5)-methyltransferase 1
LTGGFALAARWAGIETVQFVEIDKFCHKVLNKNFPGVPIHDDIKTFTYSESFRGGRILQREGGDKAFGDWSNHQSGSQVSNPFLLTGGFPCQPFSCAGKQKGTDDARYLWPEMLRVIRETKPTFIIGENVGGIINMAEFDSELEVDSETNLFGDVTINTVKRGRGVLCRIIGQLEEIGYSVQAFVIPACAVGAPHRRDRVWIVAHSILCPDRTRREPIPEKDGISGINRPSLGARVLAGTTINAPHSKSQQTHPAEPGGLHTEFSSADRNAANPERRNGEESKLQYGTLQEKGRETPSRFSDEYRITREQWSEPWLEAATRLCRVDDGVSRQMDRVNRLKALGNAIVPAVAYEIMKSILLTMETQ